MRLELRVTNYKRNPAEVLLVGSFEERDGTIGRAQENDLVLPDPSRYVSSHHATIEFRNGTYSVLDTSANGLCINDPSRKIGHGASVPLKDGDRLFIGDYEVQISLHAAFSSPSRGADFSEPQGSEKGPTATELLASLDNGAPSSMDSDDFFGSGGESPDGHWHEPVAEPAPIRQRASITQEPMPPVNAIPDNWDNLDALVPDSDYGAGASTIPEDWDSTEIKQGAPKGRPVEPAKPSTKHATGRGHQRKEAPAASRSVPPKAAKSVRSPAPASQARPAATGTASQPAHIDREALDLVLKGLGYSDLDIPDAAVPFVLELIGHLLRESVVGAMEVLRGRASIRQEMRMDLTAIRPAENNPLKFSPTIDEALTHLLAPRARGYLPPVEAIREAFEDLKIHQVATMAGMQAAMKLILKRFNPAALEQRIQKNNVLDTMIPMKRKARMWELFTELYAEIAREAEADFNAVFGQSFIRAYDKHVQQLQLARKASKSKG